MVDNYVKAATMAYRQAAKIPMLVSGRIEGFPSDKSNFLQLTSVWSQTDLASYKETKFLKSAIVDKTTLVGEQTTHALSLDSINKSTYKGDLRALVKTVTKEEKGESEQIIQIWHKDYLRDSFNLKDIDAHGKVYFDSEFGSLQLSEDSTKLIYIAEKKLAKKLPFLNQGQVAEGVEVGTQYDYREDWGEQLVGKVNPVVALMDLTSVQPATVQVFDQVPSNLSPGKVKFWQNGIVGIAYKNQPRKLGKVYCSNRDTVLFYLDFEGNYRELRNGTQINDEIGITDVVVHSESGRLCWFERLLYKNSNDKLYPGPHMAESSIVVLDKLDGEPYSIDTRTSDVSTWGGMFIPSISERSWVNEDSFLISCCMQQTLVPVLVNCKDKNIKVLSDGNENVSILDVHEGFVLGCKSDPVTYPHLVLSRWEDGLSMKPVFPSVSLENTSWAPLTLIPDGLEEDTIFAYKAIHLGSNEPNRPLIVWPHGGPHSTITETFNRTAAYFCMAGFNVLFVNYRGSLGFSDEFTRVLLGNVGDMDVKDCVMAVEKCREVFPNISKDKIFLMGGSHGGFLVTHLAGQYPDMFKGVVARNPVTNIASMCEVTDIPDWTYNESGLNYTWLNPEPDMYQEMYARSPIAHCRNIKAPVLLMIGKNDLRVPPSQGHQFYHTLKALNKEVYMHEYEDNHPLAVPSHDANVMISAAVFFWNNGAA